jgi:hypothetical protein
MIADALDISGLAVRLMLAPPIDALDGLGMTGMPKFLVLAPPAVAAPAVAAPAVVAPAVAAPPVEISPAASPPLAALLDGLLLDGLTLGDSLAFPRLGDLLRRTRVPSDGRGGLPARADADLCACAGSGCRIGPDATGPDSILSDEVLVELWGLGVERSLLFPPRERVCGREFGATSVLWRKVSGDPGSDADTEVIRWLAFGSVPRCLGSASSEKSLNFPPPESFCGRRSAVAGVVQD